MEYGNYGVVVHQPEIKLEESLIGMQKNIAEPQSSFERICKAVFQEDGLWERDE